MKTKNLTWQKGLIFLLMLLLAACGAAEQSATPTSEATAIVITEIAEVTLESTSTPAPTATVDHSGLWKVLTYNSQEQRTAVNGLDGIDDLFETAELNTDAFTVVTSSGEFFLPQEVTKVCIGIYATTSLTCMERVQLAITVVAVNETPVQVAEPNVCPEGYEGCVTTAVAGKEGLGATAYAFTTEGAQVEIGLVEAGTTIPIYWHAGPTPGGFYATYINVNQPAWVSAEFVQVENPGNVHEHPAPADWSNSTEGEAGGGSVNQAGGGIGTVDEGLTMSTWPVDEGTCTTDGWSYTIFIEGHNGTGVFDYAVGSEIIADKQTGSINTVVNGKGPNTTFNVSVNDGTVLINTPLFLTEPEACK